MADSRKSKTSSRIRVMVQTAILIALIFLMSFTPVGYLKIGPVSITFIMLPVIIGAVSISPGAGAVLGAAFGATSFIQCFGMDPFGAALLAINPFFTFIMCMVPRVLTGWLTGVIFRALKKIDKTKIVSYVVASLSGSVLNTVTFVGALILLFGHELVTNPDLLAFGMGNTIIAVISTLITVNALIEAGVCVVVGSAVTKTLDVVFRNRDSE